MRIKSVIIMPAGEYWVGDPCHAVPDDKWLEWVDQTDSDGPILTGQVGGHTVVGVSTEYGDGTYEDQFGEQYPVDAGLIGVTPVAVAEGDVDGCRHLYFPRFFTIEYDEGTIIIGHIQIPTGE